MAMRIGPFDPLQLTFEVMSSLMRKGLISYEDAVDIIRKALPPDSEMSPEEKDRIINSMVTRNPPPQVPPQ